MFLFLFVVVFCLFVWLHWVFGAACGLSLVSEQSLEHTGSVRQEYWSGVPLPSPGATIRDKKINFTLQAFVFQAFVSLGHFHTAGERYINKYTSLHRVSRAPVGPKSSSSSTPFSVPAGKRVSPDAQPSP